MDEHPVDDFRIGMVGRNAEKPAKEKRPCNDATDDRREAEQLEKPESFRAKGNDHHPS
jgi:hypothetical protein